MVITFWGARGSVPVSGAAFARAGGNTTCVELQHQGHRLILDGGTGLAALGAHARGPVTATLLFTHVHWDHIQGVPFFAPAFDPRSDLTLGGARRDSGRLADALRAQMSPPRFPITLDAVRARLRWVDLDPAEPLETGPFRVHCYDMPHPDGALAFRVECAGRSVVFATDVEHGDDLDQGLLQFAQGADLLIHDAQYTHAEYTGQVGVSRRGWGHSTLGQACAVARTAGVGQLALFHHDPQRTDDALAVLEDHARARFASTFAAREGLAVAL